MVTVRTKPEGNRALFEMFPIMIQVLLPGVSTKCPKHEELRERRGGEFDRSHRIISTL